jgi:hypothetical protein
MTMKRFLALAILSVAAHSAPALAGTVFNFSPATDGTYLCNNYCVGYVTDDPAHAFTYANVTNASPYCCSYKVTVTVDGQSYAGTSTGSGATFTAQGFDIINGVGYFNGKMITATVNWVTTTRAVNNGRAHYTIWHRYVNTGSVELP